MQLTRLKYQQRVVQPEIFPIIFAGLVLAVGSYWFVEIPGRASTRLARDSSAAPNVKINSPGSLVSEAVRIDLSRPFAKVVSHSLSANFDQETGTAQSRSTGAKTTKDLAKIPADKGVERVILPYPQTFLQQLLSSSNENANTELERQRMVYASLPEDARRALRYMALMDRMKNGESMLLMPFDVRVK